MKTVIITCDHCGKNVKEGESHPGIHEGDLCYECYDEQIGVSSNGCRLDEYLLKRWAAGGLELVAEGVSTITRVVGNTGKGISKFAVATLKLTPLETNPDLNFAIGHYDFVSFDGKKDKYGLSGYNIYRNTKLVSRIRWRKVDSGEMRWDNAYAFDKSKPGELLWNQPLKNDVTELGEIVQLALQDLEHGYDGWIGNL